MERERREREREREEARFGEGDGNCGAVEEYLDLWRRSWRRVWDDGRRIFGTDEGFLFGTGERGKGFFSEDEDG